MMHFILLVGAYLLTQCSQFCVWCKVVGAVDITFILLSRVLKALFRSGVFSDGETACHCRGKFKLRARPSDNMLGWERAGREGRAQLGEGGGRRGMGQNGVQWG